MRLNTTPAAQRDAPVPRQPPPKLLEILRHEHDALLRRVLPRIHGLELGESVLLLAPRSTPQAFGGDLCWAGGLPDYPLPAGGFESLNFTGKAEGQKV